MSQPNSFDEPMVGDELMADAPAQPEPQYRKQGFSVYTLLLLLSFLFLTIASVLFFNYAG